MATYTKHECWIIVAAYNEERHIADTVAAIGKEGFANIVVVNDGSRDRTSELAGKAIVLDHIVNLGKGAAMKTGAEYAVANGAKALFFVDADGQHNPQRLPEFLKSLNAGNDIVFGYRRKTGPAPLIRRFGGRAINVLFQLLYGIKLQDSICGFRAMSAHAYRSVRWNSRDYSVESEMIARAGNHHLAYAEVPIDTVYHDKYKGMTILDGAIVLWNLIWWRFTL